jgi:hypothetical protein
MGHAPFSPGDERCASVYPNWERWSEIIRAGAIPRGGCRRGNRWGGNKDGSRPDQAALAYEEWPDALPSQGNEMIVARGGRLHVVAVCGYEERWLMSREEREQRS